MMKLPLLLTMAVGQTGADECPAYLIASGHPRAVAAQTRPYTDCMSTPYFPAEAQLAERRLRCAALRERQIALALTALQGERRYRRSGTARLRAEAEAPFRWIDHVAASLAGCETDVRIEGDASAGRAGRVG